MNTYNRSILVLSSYVSEPVWRERGLSSRNAAETNRVARICQALAAAGWPVVLVSEAATLRMRYTGSLVHPGRSEQAPWGQVIYCAVIGLPIVGALLKPATLLWQLWRLRSKAFEAVMVYNYRPTSVIGTLFARIILHLPVVLNIEDICYPRFADWRLGRGGHPALQLFGWCLMRLMLRIATRVTCPTASFRKVLQHRHPIEVIGGCLAELPDQISLPTSSDWPLKVFYSGSVSREHGIRLVIDAFRKLDQQPDPVARLQLDICGSGADANWLAGTLSGFRAIEVTYHGFVTDVRYAELLAGSHVCLALQDPNGRHARFNIPSKAYEYFGHGKAVVVTALGDFGEMPDEARLLLQPYTSECLVQLLRPLTPEAARKLGACAQEYVRRHWSVTAGAEILRRVVNDASFAVAEGRV
jgi:glycosyltransferase involved in cell wall biosynthesis